jgi:HD-like signal output (HDOD) protein
MMASEVLSFRLDTKDAAYLRQHGLNPNEFAKTAVETYLRRLRAEASVKSLAKAAWKFPKPVEDVVRQMRDSR